MTKRICLQCAHCLRDMRHTDYRRAELFFCRSKGVFFSRNYRVGEGTRIDPLQPACPDFSDPTDKQNTLGNMR